VTVDGADVSGQDFSLTCAPTYIISGTIAVNGGGGVAGVNVVAMGTTWYGQATTGPNGQYQISTLEDDYTVTPSLSGYTFSPASRSVSLHANTSGVDFTATVLNVHTISGTVTSSGGQALYNAALTLKDGTGNTVATASSRFPDGSFSFTGVVDGAYTITGKLCAYSFTPLQVTVLGGNITGLSIVPAAAPNYTITGTVTSSVSGVGVSMISVAAIRTSDGLFVGSSTTGGDGTYSIACLDTLTYTVTPTGMFGAQYSFSPSSAQVTVTESSPTVTQNFTATPL
jgi:hypothetical protein